MITLSLDKKKIDQSATTHFLLALANDLGDILRKTLTILLRLGNELHINRKRRKRESGYETVWWIKDVL